MNRFVGLRVSWEVGENVLLGGRGKCTTGKGMNLCKDTKNDSLNCNAAVTQSTLGAYCVGAFVERARIMGKLSLQCWWAL